MDGDTIVTIRSGGQKEKGRLYSVDCPEKNQPYGLEATNATRSVVAERNVETEVLYYDRYRRSVAIVTVANGQRLQEELLQKGLAWIAPRYCKRPECIAWSKAATILMILCGIGRKIRIDRVCGGNMNGLWPIFMFLSNIALSIFTGVGIYGFSYSYFWAIIGTLILTGSSLQLHPIIALISYPLVEWFFNGSLTIYSGIIVFITFLQILSCLYIAVKSVKSEEYTGD